ncbi:NADH-quinone oxidoreductase subunit NuoG [Carnimonas nigrificans]|uniref:NADH-quinone oxidoreductase subunit NuoG n=1 Tax=Carnimonas nigrificans TaxID=64323 RepID=UPI0004709B57|nr:NADH-quinone oxidoreductase subunit NuoG [Carnimonas nigrificans]
MATIHIDGKEYEVDGADNLLQACLSLGLDVPYFCWHPSLGSVGSCRQCAVKQYRDKDDTRGRLVMSCMTGIQDDSYISIEDDEAVKFRASIVEYLMRNHPHDCPVCAEGGHCHLQDMTVMTGHSKRRYRQEKRTHQNQYLGPFVKHEMNRCIACYRCVRFYKDYAGGTDLGVYGAHDNVYFGRAKDGVLESEFSGNLTEVCPTGVFTDKTHGDHYTRKWDLQFAPSICHGCSSGCNTSPGERYGEVRRIENRYNGQVNQYFLCDRGRFGYGYVNNADRPRLALLRDPSAEEADITLSVDAALDRTAERLKRARRVIGIGSPRASLESNFALRELVGAENFSTGIEAGELERLHLMQRMLRESGLPTPSQREIEHHDAVIVLGEDLTQTAARIALSLRQAARGGAVELAGQYKIPDWNAAAIDNYAQGYKHPVFMATVTETKLDDIARGTYHGSPDEIARFGFGIAAALDASAPSVGDLDDDVQRQVADIVQVLKNAKRPLIIAGESLRSNAVLKAAFNIAKAVKGAGLNGSLTLVPSEANSMGLAMLGGESLDWAIKEFAREEADAAVVLENDLYRRLPAKRVDEALDNVDTLLVVDHTPTPTCLRADIVLPAATFAEGDGTLVSQEGRAQRFFQVYDPSYYRPNDQTHEAWRWLHALHTTIEDRKVDWTQLDQVTLEVANAVPALAGIVDAAPNASFRIKGQKIARSPHRSSGRTAMRANLSVVEPRQPQDKDSMLAFSMEGYNGTHEPRQQIPFAWSPGWNSPQAWNKFQDEVGGSLRAGDPGIRLIEPDADSDTRGLGYFSDIPSAFQLYHDRWQVVPLYHLHGSEETSARAKPVQERTPDAYIALGAADVETLGLDRASKVRVRVGKHELLLPLRISSQLRRGVIGIPRGFENIPVDIFGEWARLEQEVRA